MYPHELAAERLPTERRYYDDFEKARVQIELGMRMDIQTREAERLRDLAKESGFEEAAGCLETALCAIQDAREALA